MPAKMTSNGFRIQAHNIDTWNRNSPFTQNDDITQLYDCSSSV